MTPQKTTACRKLIHYPSTESDIHLDVACHRLHGIQVSELESFFTFEIKK